MFEFSFAHREHGSRFVIWDSLDRGQGTDMPTTIINLKVKTVEEKAVTPQRTISWAT
jgi:hypothetical protein